MLGKVVHQPDLAAALAVAAADSAYLRQRGLLNTHRLPTTRKKSSAEKRGFLDGLRELFN